MKVTLGSRKRHYMVRASICLITAALVWAVMGCTAVYPIEYKLIISSTTGGSVVDPDEGISTHVQGTRVYLIADPDDGYRFVSWTGDVGTIRDVKDAQTVMTIRGDHSITAEFEKMPEYHLKVSTTVGGRVIKPREETSTYKGEKVVDLEAHEDVGWGFVNWTGNVSTIANVNVAVTTITMDGNYSIVANFEEEAAVNITDTNLEAVMKAATRISDRPIYPSDLKRLTSLEAGAKNISELTALEYCTGLTRLYLYDNQIDDISPVANLTRLTYLDLSGNRIDDISPVANLTSLAYLDLSGNQMGDISPVANLTSLKEVYLSGNRIYDISLVADLTCLTCLDLSGNRIDDISPVANLTSLKEVYLSANRIGDISPLASLTSLRKLYVSDNQISDISPLASLTSLRELYVSDNQISDISPLAGLASLTELYVSDNQVSNISLLASLGSLTCLYLSGNEISDISPLASLSRLRDLSLAGNQIDDISPLASLSNLTLLNLSNNQISDIEPLVDNPGLSWGDKVYLYNALSYSPLSYGYVSTYITELEMRGVIVEY